MIPRDFWVRSVLLIIDTVLIAMLIFWLYQLLKWIFA